MEIEKCKLFLSNLMLTHRFLSTFNEIIEFCVTVLFVWSLFAVTSTLLSLKLSLDEYTMHKASLP